MRFLVVLALASLCAACATVPPPATASGKPEVTISNSSPDKVKPVLVNKMINTGYRITKDTPYELTFDKPTQNFAVAALMGSKYDGVPNERVSYTFADVGGSTRVVADVAIITNPGSAYERRTDLNGGAYNYDLQIMLDDVNASLDPNSQMAVARQNKIILGIGLWSAPRAKAALMQGPDKGLYVVNVETGSLADQAGIKKGDVILQFGSQETNSMHDIEAAQAATKPGSTVKLAMWREGKEQELSITFPSVSPVAAPAVTSKRAAHASAAR
jgi:C-terminal processing protease CtpA/Prc